jgi:hypothetical protein
MDQYFRIKQPLPSGSSSHKHVSVGTPERNVRTSKRNDFLAAFKAIKINEL